ncbi:Uncharacterized protein Adt_39491 [Abeliophyllum distichum]|uniref:Uncharacterized protein n=1 Tax=Abeliophyllum distichum TaxID=126358 RepID=A0ABD1Q5G0_9LAMI
MDFGESSCHLKKFIEFLVVDTRSAYHGVLGWPTFKDLQAVISIHHLVMKFPTPGGIAKVRSNQTEARGCYMYALQKVAKCEDGLVVVMMVQIKSMDVDPVKAEKEMILDEDLNLQIIGPDSFVSLMEELEAFLVTLSTLPRCCK